MADSLLVQKLHNIEILVEISIGKTQYNIIADIKKHCTVAANAYTIFKKWYLVTIAKALFKGNALV